MHAREDIKQVVTRVHNQVPAVRDVPASLPADGTRRAGYRTAGDDRAWTSVVVPDTAPGVVQGEPLTFDGLLAGIWADAAGSHPELRACAVLGPLDGELWGYAQAFSALLGVRPTRMTVEDGIDALVSSTDLVIMGGDCQASIRCVLSQRRTEGGGAAGLAAAPVAVLAAQKPRWPLVRILLILSGDAGDLAAVDWALRLARPATAHVAVLAVVPPVPTMYHGLSRMEQTLRSLLSTDTALGHQMRQASARLVESGVDSTLRLRQGSPEHQVCREIVESAYDLVIMATNPCRWWLRRLKGDSVCWLLSRIDRPLLLVEPATG